MERCSSPRCDGRSEARTQGASIAGSYRRDWRTWPGASSAARRLAGVPAGLLVSGRPFSSASSRPPRCLRWPARRRGGLARLRRRRRRPRGCALAITPSDAAGRGRAVPPCGPADRGRAGRAPSAGAVPPRRAGSVHVRNRPDARRRGGRDRPRPRRRRQGDPRQGRQPPAGDDPRAARSLVRPRACRPPRPGLGPACRRLPPGRRKASSSHSTSRPRMRSRAARIVLYQIICAESLDAALRRAADTHLGGYRRGGRRRRRDADHRRQGAPPSSLRGAGGAGSGAWGTVDVDRAGRRRHRRAHPRCRRTRPAVRVRPYGDAGKHLLFVGRRLATSSTSGTASCHPWEAWSSSTRVAAKRSTALAPSPPRRRSARRLLTAAPG